MSLHFVMFHHQNSGPEISPLRPNRDEHWTMTTSCCTVVHWPTIFPNNLRCMVAKCLTKTWWTAAHRLGQGETEKNHFGKINVNWNTPCTCRLLRIGHNATKTRRSLLQSSRRIMWSSAPLVHLAVFRLCAVFVWNVIPPEPVQNRRSRRKFFDINTKKFSCPRKRQKNTFITLENTHFNFSNKILFLNMRTPFLYDNDEILSSIMLAKSDVQLILFLISIRSFACSPDKKTPCVGKIFWTWTRPFEFLCSHVQK